MKHLQGSSCFAPLKSRRWTAERYPLSPPGDPASASTQSPETAHNRFPSQPALGPVGSWKRHPAGSAPSGMFQSPFAPDRVAAFRETAQRNCAPRPRNTGWFFRPHPDPATPRYTRPATSGLCSAVPPPVALLDAYQSSFQICYASNIMRNCRICNKYFEGKEMNGVETLYYA